MVRTGEASVLSDKSRKNVAPPSTAPTGEIAQPAHAAIRKFARRERERSDMTK
jgi:hypothetical protein